MSHHPDRGPTTQSTYRRVFFVARSRTLIYLLGLLGPLVICLVNEFEATRADSRQGVHLRSPRFRLE
jgi:hypothetical protein